MGPDTVVVGWLNFDLPKKVVKMSCEFPYKTPGFGGLPTKFSPLKLLEGHFRFISH